MCGCTNYHCIRYKKIKFIGSLVADLGSLVADLAVFTLPDNAEKPTPPSVHRLNRQSNRAQSSSA